MPYLLDFTPKNVVLKLNKSFDSLTEDQLYELLGPPDAYSLDRFFPETEALAPTPSYVVAAADFTLLPWSYISTTLCLIDFDHAYLTDTPPRELSHIPPDYLAPENIFDLINGPASDVWALGCMLYELRVSFSLFQDMGGNSPLIAVSRMCEVLGMPPKQWTTVPFCKGYPVHQSLDQKKPDHEYRSLDDFLEDEEFTLDKEVEIIRIAQRPETSDPTADTDARTMFCLPVPCFFDTKLRDAFRAQYLSHIKKDDAALFTDLLKKIFDYDYTKRLTAREVAEHPWFQYEEAGKEAHSGA